MPLFYGGQPLTAAVLNLLPQPLGGRILIQSGAYLTTSGTTELKLPKLALTAITWSANAGRRFRLAARLTGGTGGDAFEFRVRQTTDTGTIVVGWRHDVKSGNQSDVVYENLDAPTSAVNNDSFYLSVIRLAGSGTLTVQADRETSFAVDSALNSTYVVPVP